MDNPLDPDLIARAAMHAHLHKCIDAAAAIGAPTVGTFVGRNPHRSVKDNLVEAAESFRPFVDHAGERGVSIVIENCVMEGWHPDGYPGNLAYCPELWEWMFEQGLYLNFDPSHLLWIGAGLDKLAPDALTAHAIGAAAFDAMKSTTDADTLVVTRVLAEGHGPDKVCATVFGRPVRLTKPGARRTPSDPTDRDSDDLLER